jgi:hypothetical protein
MLGERIGEFQGKVTGQRVLPPEGGRPRFETTVEISGTILSVPTRVLATYGSVMLPDGSLYGEVVGGVFITQDGKDMATYKATGAGRSEYWPNSG